MAFDYAQAARDALALIQDAGVAVPMTRVTAGVYDPATGGTSGAVTTAQQVTVVCVPGTAGQTGVFEDAMKSELVKGRVRFFIGAALGLTFAPAPGDRVTWEAKEWQVFGSTPLSPAGTPLIYEFSAREGAVT